jgi:hypothetical protein
MGAAWKCGGLLLSLGVLVLAVSACASAPSSRLYYIWARNCAPPPVGTINKPAGFTSAAAAQRAAAIETAATIEYWRKYNRETAEALREVLAHRSMPAAARAKRIRELKDHLVLGNIQLKGNLPPCARYVVKGKPNPPR